MDHSLYLWNLIFLIHFLFLNVDCFSPHFIFLFIVRVLFSNFISIIFKLIFIALLSYYVLLICFQHFWLLRFVWYFFQPRLGCTLWWFLLFVQPWFVLRFWYFFFLWWCYYYTFWDDILPDSVESSSSGWVLASSSIEPNVRTAIVFTLI